MRAQAGVELEDEAEVQQSVTTDTTRRLLRVVVLLHHVGGLREPYVLVVALGAAMQTVTATGIVSYPPSASLT